MAAKKKKKKKKKRRTATAKQRVAEAKRCNNGDRKHIDFDYDETSEVLRLTLDTIKEDAEHARKKVADVADKLHSLVPPEV